VNAPSSRNGRSGSATAPTPLPFTSCATAPIDGSAGARTISDPPGADTSGRRPGRRRRFRARSCTSSSCRRSPGRASRHSLGDELARSTRRQEYPTRCRTRRAPSPSPPITLSKGVVRRTRQGRWLKSIETRRLVHVLEGSPSSAPRRLPHRRVDLIRRGASGQAPPSGPPRKRSGWGTRIAIPSSLPFSSG